MAKTRNALRLALVVVLTTGAIARGAHQPPARDRVQGWREDLATLVRELPARHKDPFTVVSRAQFEAEAKGIDARLETLTDAQIYVELKRLVARIGDAHTNIHDGKGRYLQRYFPFNVIWLSDGIFIHATTEEHRELLGRRLLRIGTTEMEEAARRLGELIPHENEYWVKHQLRQVVNSPEALAALGLIEDIDRADFTVRDARGRDEVVKLAPMPKGMRLTVVKPSPGQDRLPISRQPRQALFGSQMLPNCQNMKDKTVAVFAKETLDFIDKEKPERVIVDLRRNGGGNSALIWPLVLGLGSRTKATPPLALFALIGRATFSSGLWAAQDLRSTAKAVLVGEPTGQKPNSFGEVRSCELPNSSLTLFYSTRLWKRVPTGDPIALEPDVRADSSSTDYFSDRDIAIEAVRAYRAK
jgi:hypothetical protein